MEPMAVSFLTRTATAGTLAVALCVGTAAASSRESSISQHDVVSSEGFLSAHPDLRWRLEGMEAYDQGQHGFAADYFRRAARFADKPAQAMYATMLWKGEGVEQDRPLAYAWMDLAAERGYPHFIAHREKYWDQLDAAEREDATRRGAAVYAEYGDEVAKPRLESRLHRGRKVTGSRVGFVGALTIMLPDGVTVTGDDYYQDRYWKPRAYWAWQDRTWGRPPTGDATVGDLEALDRKQEQNGDPP